MNARVIVNLIACVVALACAAPASALVPDGGLVRTPDMSVYRIVGGAPLPMSSCSYTNGCAGYVSIPNLSGYPIYPRDGATVRDVDSGNAFRFVGGAPLLITRCDYGDRCAGAITVDWWSTTVGAHVRAMPADGTTVVDADDGGTYRFAGGAPLLISRCDYGGGCANAAMVDNGTLAQLGAPLGGAPRMRAIPPDGTALSDADDGGVYRLFAGAPLWVPSCDGCAAAVAVDQGTFDRLGTLTPSMPHLRQYPTDGAYLHLRGTGAFFRMAGGAAIPLTTCVPLDGTCSGALDVDPATLAALGRGHLRALPADGTIVRAMPSQTLWEFAGGLRRSTFASAGAVQIDDAAVDALPLLGAEPAAIPPAPTTTPAATPTTPVAPPVHGSGVAPPFTPVFLSAYRVSAGRTRFTGLSVRDLPAGSRLTVTCKGHGCPLKSKRFTPKKGRVDLTTTLAHARLRSGVVLTLTATGPTGARKVMAFQVRSGARVPVRRIRCAPAGGKLGAC